jgi:BlaI family transcriptional regulator, penicillinase repressor
MLNPRKPRPTEAELAILQVLWRQGPATVREVHEALSHRKESTYTTTLKLLQIMREKGLVKRNEDHKSHVYAAADKAEDTQRQLVGNLLEQAFGGSTSQLVLRALSAKPASAGELAEIRQIIEQLENDTSK